MKFTYMLCSSGSRIAILCITELIGEQRRAFVLFTVQFLYGYSVAVCSHIERGYKINEKHSGNNRNTYMLRHYQLFMHILKLIFSWAPFPPPLPPSESPKKWKRYAYKLIVGWSLFFLIHLLYLFTIYLASSFTGEYGYEVTWMRLLLKIQLLCGAELFCARMLPSGYSNSARFGGLYEWKHKSSAHHVTVFWCSFAKHLWIHYFRKSNQIRWEKLCQKWNETNMYVCMYTLFVVTTNLYSAQVSWFSYLTAHTWCFYAYASVQSQNNGRRKCYKYELRPHNTPNALQSSWILTSYLKTWKEARN